MAAVAPALVVPRVGAELAVLRNHVERPPQRARPHVEGADVAARLCHSRGAVGHRLAHDDEVSSDQRDPGPPVW